ncbi:cation-translocating P-type ATPase [Anaerotignum lactatifermentans]|uniref:Cation-translocating P-type ATPase n=1 Tax=Anaerotignum lactatifermentans TaxID=160404 RepID=A0ABS2G7A1_9FIRM|nr:cation-translocating P-type ATPase [Anaerotignum lactatifermentans]MBM6829042.1 cation-translocating P-type ATPase [Anaerotignum lactatifermentans]MBM6877351.1 cation-translocating P-type ATPase [Anaerotignum lactatifermentans]MBM6950721.1 cation-translocating P-type ATPase [Anaerotignum lactatifermentans]
MTQLWKMPQKEILREYETTMDGLTQAEAKRRLEQYGYNKLQEQKRKGVLQVFAEQFADLLVVILIIAAVISALTGGLEGTIVILVVLVMNAILGTVQHFKAQKSLDSLKAMAAPNARVIRDGQRMEVPAAELVPGDILLLEAGDVTAADGRVLRNYSLQVNESALTGESENVNKTDEAIDQEELPLGDRLNMVYSSSLVSYGRAVVLVTGTGMQTEIGKIADLMESAQEKTTPLQRSLDDFSKKLSVIIIVICAIVFGLSVWRDMGLADALMFAVALAVAAIPEALSSIVTIGLAIGTQKMARENAIIKNLRAVEGLGCVSVICSDKTGTLTQNRMTVQQCYTGGRVWSTAEAAEDCAAVESLVAESVLCNDGVISDDAAIGDPTETALLTFCRRIDRNERKIRDEFPRLQEIPFDSDRKLMSTLHFRNGRHEMLTKGAPDVLLKRCTHIEENGQFRELTEDDCQKIIEQNRAFSSQGLRVLAFAKKVLSENRPMTLEDERELVFTGLIAMMDPPREESAPAVADCRRAGIRPVMITGDHKITASAIAKKIGILQEGDKAVEGSELEKMTDEELRQEVSKISVYARVSPEHKIRIVRAWQDNGYVAAMTGDGVNDAPALKQADIGIAMGITGTEVSKDAASMILTDDNFATIVKAVANGRNVYTNIKNSIQFLLSGNLAGILVVVFTSLMGLPLPFTAVQLLFINLLTDSLPALAVNMEQPTGDLLDQKPRSPKEGILTGDFLRNLGVQGLLIGAASMAAFYLGLAVNDGMACTMAFATLCLARLFHGFNCRGTHSVFRLPSNPYSIGAFAVGTVLLMVVLFVPGLHGLFDIDNALTGRNVLQIIGLAFAPTFLIQLSRIVRGK